MRLLCRTCTKLRGRRHYCGRVVSVFESKGKALPEPEDRCAHCSGEAYGKVTVPTDQKLWLMAEVERNQYEADRTTGKLRMKDWAQGEFEQKLGRRDPEEVSDEEQARREKRERARNSRKAPLTPTEIARITEAFGTGRMQRRAHDAGLVLAE